MSDQYFFDRAAGLGLHWRQIWLGCCGILLLTCLQGPVYGVLTRASGKSHPLHSTSITTLGPVSAGVFRPRRIQAHHTSGAPAKAPATSAGGWFAAMLLGLSLPRFFKRRRSTPQDGAPSRLTERHYRALTQACAQLVWVSDPHGLALDDLQPWSALTGLPEPLLREHGVRQAVHPDDRPQFDACWEAARRAQSVFMIKCRLHHRQARERFYLFMAVPSLNGEGLLTGWAGMAIDIHDQHLAEIDGRRRQAALERQLAAQSAARARAEQALTAVQERLRAQTAATQELQQAAAATEEALRQAQATLERRVAQRTTELARVNEALRAEVAEHQRTEATLRENQNHDRLLVESIPQIVWTARPDGAPRFINRFFTHYTGLSEAEALERDWLAIVHPEDQPLAREFWHRTLRAEQGDSSEQRLRRADGLYRWHQVRVLPVRGAQDQVSEWLITAIDIDERKLADLALREANRRKDEFLAMLAHELRNPLAPIRYAVEVLRHNEESEEALGSRQREMIDRQVSTMAHLLDDLLDVSRITQGKFILKKRPVDLRQVAADCVENCRAALSGRGHQLYHMQPGEALWVEGDPTRLEQIISNLLNNAIKYTEAGGHIWLTLEQEPADEKAWATVRVRDSGLGIAPEVLPRIFDLFTQAEQALERAQGGLGIGLTLVRNLVQLHGGTVTAHSAGLGQGSEFTIRLPLTVAPEAAQPETATPETPAADAGGAAPGPQRILIVDDNTDTARSLAELIELWGYQPAIAFDGQKAVAMAGPFRPAVVLLDVGLPDMDGYTVARRLRDDPELQDVVVIALTGFEGEDERQRAQAAGVQHFFTKPVDLMALREKLDGLSGQPRS